MAVINNAAGYFKLNRNDEEIHGMKMDSCFVEKGDFDCARAARMRNYYIYLWGLPMKLMDEGTVLAEETKEVVYNGIPCYGISVAYEEDEWTYFLARDNYRMIAYMFFKPRGQEKGEYILLENEIEVNGIKIPKERSWYTLPDSVFLGTDILVGYE